AYVWKWKSVVRRKHELLITPALALVAVCLFVGFSRTTGSLGFRASSLTAVAKDSAVVDRMNLWRVALDTIAARPIFGWGIGTYAVAQIPFNSHSQSELNLVKNGPSMTESPHNTYLQIAAEQGWIGLAFYLAILGFFFAYGIAALRRM